MDYGNAVIIDFGGYRLVKRFTLSLATHMKLVGGMEHVKESTACFLLYVWRQPTKHKRRSEIK